MNQATRSDSTPPTAGKLGMFAGVFTPSVLTILGLILFLRLGYVVGELGLRAALGVIILANAISILTTLSLAAIATNLQVKGGGIYYLIARTLGVEHGGTIGIVLFVAQSVSVGFYCVGFAEVVSIMLELGSPVATQLLATAAIAVLMGLAWLGADWATRFQYVIMALLVLALVSFSVGAFEHWDRSVFEENFAAPGNAMPFWIGFAIFFPAVTGFTQGVSMSGDLRNPGRAIPLGSFLAVGLSFAIYLAATVLLAGAAGSSELRGNFSVMKSVSAYAPLIDAGVIAATLSSALASLLGAPRILQSLARDKVFSVLQPFAQGAGRSNNPRRAVFLSGAIGLATVALGSLNLIASVVSMFFLVSYALINYATWFVARSASPSFRPSFRFFDRRVSLAAALGCLATMIVIDFRAGIAAVAVMAAIYQFIRYRGAPARWADGRRSFHLQVVRENLFAAAKEEVHPRDWRPMFLVFSQDPARRDRLLLLATSLEGRSGLTTVVRVIEGNKKELLDRREQAVAELEAAIAAAESAAFPLVVAARDIDEAIPAVIQSAGVGPLKANTVLANWLRLRPTQSGALAGIRFANNLRTAAALGCNLLVLHAEDARWQALGELPSDERVIDVWWTSGKTSEFCLLLAHLMKRTERWSEARIRVLTLSETADAGDRTEALRQTLAEVRVEAEPIAVSHAGPDAIVENSSLASLVFLPATIRGGRFYHPFGGEVPEILERLPITFLATAVQDVDLDADPDEIDDAPEDAEPATEPGASPAEASGRDRHE